MEIALYPSTEVYAGSMWWPWERSAEVLHRWREWTETAPEEVTTSEEATPEAPAEAVADDPSDASTAEASAEETTEG